MSVELPRATSVKLGIMVGRELLPTRVVLAVRGGIPNRERLPVKGMGRGRCASGCHVCGSEYWSSLLEAGDDIVRGEWCVSQLVLGTLLPWRSPSRCSCLRISSAYTSVRIRMVVKVVAMAMAMAIPKLISWRLVRSGLIDEHGVLGGGGIDRR